MSVFQDYSRYYGLLYKDKDYPGESAYIQRILAKVAPTSSKILEFGCGNGIHAGLLAENGWSITGVERSETMLAEAEARREQSPEPIKSRQRFLLGDLRTFRSDQTFDVCISLFHVLSYQTSNEDIRAAFLTARSHLNVGGIFIFDVWHGPAVLSQLPATRIKRMEDEDLRIIRIAEPNWHSERNVVDVNYHILANDKRLGLWQETTERHSMRYFFKPEIEALAASEDFRILRSEEWMSSLPPSPQTWGVCYILQAI